MNQTKGGLAAFVRQRPELWISVGYFIVYREDNADASAWVKTWLDSGEKVTLTPLMGGGKACETAADDEGRVRFTLADKNSFALYKYEIN